MYISINQAAEKLGVSTKTIQRWIASGKLKAYKLSEHCVRIDPADLEAFVNESAT